jgi:hypothetical protein
MFKLKVVLKQLWGELALLVICYKITYAMGDCKMILRMFGNHFSQANNLFFKI